MYGEIRPARAERIASRHRLTGVVALALSYALCMAAVLFSVLPARGIVEVGQASPQTFHAPYAMEDEAATSDLRAKAAAAVEEIYQTDYRATEQAEDRLEAYLSAIDRMRADAATLREKEAKNNKTAAQKGDLTADEWREVIGEDEITVLRSTDAEGVTGDEIYEILAVPASEMRIWTREALVRISKALRAGIRAEDLNKARTNAVSALTPYTPAGIVSLNGKIVGRFIVATSLYDDETTQQERSAAASAVSPSMIAAGEPIVQKDEPVTERTYAILSKLGYVHTPAETILKMVLLCAVLLGCFLIFALFTRLYLPQLTASPGTASLQAILLVVTVSVGVLTFRLNPHFNPAYLCAVLFTLLISARSAVSVSLLVSVLLGILAGGSVAFDFANMAQTILTSAVGALTGILLVRKTSHRFSIISAGLASGGAMSLIYAMFDIWKSLPASDILMDMLWGLGSGLAFAVAGIGLLPLWEWLFDIATPARLVELGNVNNPLLKRLMLEAPGTYHHSMMVATLAEAAANAVGANALLARVGAYYHDIGKIRRPYYFKENQRANDNPHDSMDAGRKRVDHHLPCQGRADVLAKGAAARSRAQDHRRAPRDDACDVFLPQGSSGVGRSAASDDRLRYAGPKPTTKESAIVMLADSVEAGVRSLDSATRDKVEEMTHKIVNGKIHDGQMSSAPILFADVDLISHAMIKAFNGILHERIEYPEINGMGEENSD